MNKPISIELLEKYVNGECTPEEVALVKKWYFSFDDEPDHVSELTLFEEQKLEEQIYSRILDKIGVTEELEEEETAEPQIVQKRSGFKIWYAAAAVAAALILYIGVFYHNKIQAVGDKQIADAHAQEMEMITNNTRQIYKKVLSDNSIVWLSPKASITCPKAFDSRFRAITMSGECFFEVTKNPKRPFIINSRSIITKVWGTSFRVRDADQSSSADVSVVTGKVSVSIKHKCTDTDYKLEKDEVILYPHQKVVYMIGQNTLKPAKGDEPEMRIWNAVNLSFDSKPLSEIIPVLNSKFHVHIKVMNERLNHYILNADMVGFNLPDVLEALRKSLNVNYEIVNNAIELE